jgi:hypothetical protein
MFDINDVTIPVIFTCFFGVGVFITVLMNKIFGIPVDSALKIYTWGFTIVFCPLIVVLSQFSATKPSEETLVTLSFVFLSFVVVIMFEYFIYRFQHAFKNVQVSSFI